MSDPRDVERARETASVVYEGVRERFLSKQGAGADGTEFWWDWLAVWIPDQIIRALAETRREDQEEIEQEVRRLIVIERATEREVEQLRAIIGEYLADNPEAFSAELNAGLVSEWWKTDTADRLLERCRSAAHYWRREIEAIERDLADEKRAAAVARDEKAEAEREVDLWRAKAKIRDGTFGGVGPDTEEGKK